MLSYECVDAGGGPPGESRPQAGAPPVTGEAAAVELFADWASLARLQPEWNELLGRSGSDTLFLTWEWINAWAEVVGGAVQPFVLAARSPDGRLVGLAPFYLSLTWLLGGLPFRALRILGDRHSGAEYGDWILERGREAETARALAQALAAARGRWDCLWMPNTSGWTGARDRIVPACAESGLKARERSIEFSSVSLPPRYEDYWNRLSRNRRSVVRRQAKKAAAQGATLETCATADRLEDWVEALATLNHRRWSAMGQVGTFKRKPFELAFYRRFTPVALARGWLRMFGLNVGGAPKAIQIGYAYKGSFLQLQEGFDPNASPGIGNVLRARVIESCIGEGVTTYDFLGEHNEHKRRWLAEVRPGSDLLITHGGWRSTLLHSLGVWPTGRFLRPQSIAPAGGPS